jgi:hypothetical protein
VTKLAAYIARQDKLGWDAQLEEDFSPSGQHAWRSQESMPKLTQGSSCRCREVHALACYED